MTNQKKTESKEKIKKVKKTSKPKRQMMPIPFSSKDEEDLLPPSVHK